MYMYINFASFNSNLVFSRGFHSGNSLFVAKEDGLTLYKTCLSSHSQAWIDKNCDQRYIKIFLF